MERRRHDRALIATRPSIEEALGSWRLLQQAWEVVFEGARAAQNRERMALAESKLGEASDQVARLETLLRT